MVTFLSRPIFTLQKTRDKMPWAELGAPEGTQEHWLTRHQSPLCYAVPPGFFKCQPHQEGWSPPWMGPCPAGTCPVSCTWIITSTWSRTLVTLQSLPHWQGLSHQLYKSSCHCAMFWISLVQRASRNFPGVKGRFPKARALHRKRDAVPVSTHSRLCRDQSLCAHTRDTSLCVCTEVCKASLHWNQSCSARFGKWYYL